MRLKSQALGHFIFILAMGFSTAAFSAVTVKAVVPKVSNEFWERSHFDLSYSLRTDLNEIKDKSSQYAQYTHNISAGYSYELIPKKLTGGIILGLSYYSVGNNIVKNEDNPQFDDITLAATYNFDLLHKADSILAITNSLPTSQSSQIEGYKSILGLSYNLSLPIFSLPLSFNQNLTVGGIFNTYSESPTTLSSNPLASEAYTASVRFKWKSFFAGLGGKVKNTNYINGENKINVSSSEFMGLNIKSFSLLLSLVNGTTDEYVKPQFWYFNEYQRLIKFEVQYAI